MNDIEHRQTLRQLWIDHRPDERRTAAEVVLFHAWLKRNWPELLNKRTLDDLKADLESLYR